MSSSPQRRLLYLVGAVSKPHTLYLVSVSSPRKHDTHLHAHHSPAGPPRSKVGVSLPPSSLLLLTTFLTLELAAAAAAAAVSAAGPGATGTGNARPAPRCQHVTATTHRRSLRYRQQGSRGVSDRPREAPRGRRLLTDTHLGPSTSPAVPDISILPYRH